MLQRSAAICLICLLAAVAGADRLILTDGRTFSGTVTVERDTVLIALDYGALRFNRSEVARIEFKDTPEAELAKRMESVDRTKPDALFALAQWAAGEGLASQANGLYQRVIALDPNHAAARRALGFVRVDGQYKPLAIAIEAARGKLQAGQVRGLLDDLLPQIELVAPPAVLPVVRELRGQAHLRAAEYAQAAKAYRDLAAKASGADKVRFAAVADVLESHEDGMYVLSESYPPTARLLGDNTQVLEAGPAPLSHPLAMEAALRDTARKHIDAGQAVMDEAQKLDASDPEAARAKYDQADKELDQADAIVSGISRSYRIEIARRRIASLRKDCTAGAEKFDKEMATLGKQTMAPAAYRTKVQRLIYLLDRVRTDLKEILKIADPYFRELILEVKWAQLDLEKMDRMRRILTEELDGKK